MTDTERFPDSPHVDAKHWAKLVDARRRIVELEIKLAEVRGERDELDRQLTVALAEVKRLVNLPAAVQQPNRDVLWGAIQKVLQNTGNYPERAQSRIMGTDVRPLTERVTDAVLATLPIPATGEVEWEYAIRADGDDEHRFPADSEADARATASERGEVVVRRNIGPWVEVTP